MDENQNDTAPANDSESSNASDHSAAFDISAVINDAKKVITDPVGFYKNMPQQGGLVNPMLFVVCMSLVTWLLGWVLGVVGIAKFNAAAMGAVGIAGIIFVPIASVLGSFIGGAILFVIWRLMGSTKNYETAYRSVAYSFAIMPIVAVLSVIPYIANIIKTVWMMFLMYLASVHVQDVKDSTSKIVFGVLAVVLIYSGFQSERLARKWSSAAERISVNLEKEYKDGSIGNALQNLESVEDMTPEEAGEQMGKFLKGLEQFSKGVEEEVKKQKED